MILDREKRTLTVADNGIGMTRDEVVRYLGTIAKSGTREFLAAAKEDAAAGERMIGQFGVGFYSAFMAADRVEVVTRKLGEPDACRFNSTGEGEFSVADASRDECGTSVTLWLRPVKEGEKDYSEEWTVRDVIRQYSDFIAWPVVMPVVRKKDGKETVEDEVLNSQKAI